MTKTKFPRYGVYLGQNARGEDRYEVWVEDEYGAKQKLRASAMTSQAAHDARRVFQAQDRGQEC